jgi:HEAT repeat protein
MQRQLHFAVAVCLALLGPERASAQDRAQTKDSKPDTAKVPHLTIKANDLPFKKEVALRRGEGIRLTLPIGKDVAIWCKKGSPLEQLLDNSDFQLEYGEKPFIELKYRQWQEGARQMSALDSYIQQGAVVTWSGGPGHEVQLYVEKYFIALREEGPSKGALPIKIHVRLATEEELEDQLHGNKAKEYFVPRLKADKPAVRIRALTKLGEFRPEVLDDDGAEARVLCKLIQPLLEDSEEQVRATAEQVLRGLGDEDALLRYIKPLPRGSAKSADGGRYVGLCCRRGSAEIVAAHVLTFLDADDDALRRFAITFFDMYQYKPAKEKLVKALRKALADPSPGVRLWAIDVARGTIPKEIPPVLAELIEDKDPKIRQQALGEVWHFAGEIPTAKLTARLKDSEAGVREMAAHALDGCKDPQVIAPLLESTRDPAAEVRAAAAVTLGTIGTSKAYMRLTELLADKEETVRESALNGLRWLRDRRAILIIEKLLENEKSQQVRDMAERTIRELKLQGR